MEICISISARLMLGRKFYVSKSIGLASRGGGGYCQIWAIWVFAAVKGMVFKQLTLG